MLRRIHESSPSFCEGSGCGAPHPPVVVSARPPRGVLTIAGLTRSHAQGRPRTCACAGLTGVRRGGGARLTGERGTRFPGHRGCRRVSFQKAARVHGGLR